jgi:hypothetical protein
MIKVKKSLTADTRSCDWSKVTKEQLIESTHSHIGDVIHAIQFFKTHMDLACLAHDNTKLSFIDQFYADFKTGFKENTWYEMHKRAERHHISVPEGVRDDVNLVDVIEHICDCVMAGMARTGMVYELKLPDEVLQKAFQNTVKMLKESVEVVNE